MTRVAIYARVSTNDQNCDRQIRDLTDYAQRCDYEVVGIYKETGSGKKNDRKERAKVIDLARARKIDAILVTELTRWGRSTSDLLETMQLLKSWNVSLIAQNGFQFDLSTPHGKLIAQLLASLAEFERDLICERVKSGLSLAKARGKRLGRAAGTCPQQQKLRNKILSLRDEGMSIRRIATNLDCSPGTVQKVLNINKVAV